MDVNSIIVLNTPFCLLPPSKIAILHIPMNPIALQGYIFWRNPIYSGTFLSYPEQLRYALPPENRKIMKRNTKIMCLYQRYS